MRQEWEALYQAALAVAKPKKLSEQMEAGWVGEIGRASWRERVFGLV